MPQKLQSAANHHFLPALSKITPLGLDQESVFYSKRSFIAESAEHLKAGMCRGCLKREHAAHEYEELSLPVINIHMMLDTLAGHIK